MLRVPDHAGERVKVRGESRRCVGLRGRLLFFVVFCLKGDTASLFCFNLRRCE